MQRTQSQPFGTPFFIQTEIKEQKTTNHRLGLMYINFDSIQIRMDVFKTEFRKSAYQGFRRMSRAIAFSNGN